MKRKYIKSKLKIRRIKRRDLNQEKIKYHLRQCRVKNPKAKFNKLHNNFLTENKIKDLPMFLRVMKNNNKKKKKSEMVKTKNWITATLWIFSSRIEAKIKVRYSGSIIKSQFRGRELIKRKIQIKSIIGY